jgi:integrase
VFLERLGRRAGVKKAHPHRFRHTFATWAIENGARELDVQHLLGHSTPAMVRRYSATYDAEKAARAHEQFSPADRLNGRLEDGGNGPRESSVFPEASLKFSNLGL